MSRDKLSHCPNLYTGGVDMDNHVRIKLERTARGMSQKELGAAVGITQAAIEKIESGKTAKSRYVADLLRYLGLREDALDVPVVGYVSAGMTAIAFADAQGPFDMVKGPHDTTPATVAVAIRGESLGPVFAGWYVFYDDIREPPTPDLMGHLCVVVLPDDRAFIKQLKASRTPGLYHLISQGGEPPMTDVAVAWAARVKYLSPGLGYR